MVQSFEEFEAILDNNPGLSEIITEPFTIRLLIGVLCDLHEKLKKNSPNIRLTMFELL